MAEEIEEEIVIIEESEAANLDDSVDNDSISDEELRKKKLLIFGGAGIGLLLIIIISIVLLLKPTEKEVPMSMNFIDKKLEKKTTIPIEPSKLENMISKANYLYTNGSKDEALSIYEKIALYSEAISFYNLGVAQLKNKQYKMALETFKKAITSDEKRCVSAINAAVCCLHLKDENRFKYYIDLAYAYLPNEVNSPLYSYYYSLIKYYNENYLESLSALKNQTSNEYPNTQKHLSAKINALFGNNYDAIESMEKYSLPNDSFSIALLYARVGNLNLAKKNFEDSILHNIKPIKSQIALGLVDLKLGLVKTGSKEITNVTDMFGEEVYKPYPIRVTLKKSLFDSLEAQKHYRNIVNNKRMNYAKLFYFSPYKIFNANQTIRYIRKGNANIFIDNINSAEDYLKKGASSSNVNIGITKAIKKALKFKIREANVILQKLVKVQPRHSILHYDLALTYAQLGNMIEANKHFVRSYHLDAKNYLSGVYAVITNEILNINNVKLKSNLRDDLEAEDQNEKIDFYKTLLAVNNNNILVMLEWLTKKYKKTPLYLAMDITIALALNKSQVAKQSSKELSNLLPNEILPHLMYIDANFDNMSYKKYAKEVHNYLKKQKFSFNDFYYGPQIVRYLYIQQNLITGRLYYLREQIKSVLETKKGSRQDLISSLALSSLYNKNFEESYTLYNQLIDDLKVRDAHTLFLGAVASTVANHHGNAIALLELSKMKDTNFLESRYALGLLYLELKNNQGAVIQLARVGDNNFKSEYFNFDIDLDKLLFEKQHK
jgi:predicted Zn-dependent protease